LNLHMLTATARTVHNTKVHVLLLPGPTWTFR